MNSLPNTPEVLMALVKAYNENRREPIFNFRIKRGRTWQLVPAYARYLIEYMAHSQGKGFAIDPKTKRITIL